MDARRRRCLGGEAALKALRGRLTGRDRDLIGLGLDRVLWSALLAARDRALFLASALELQEGDLLELARLSLRHGIDLVGERIDRVFLHRATENVLARRLLTTLRPSGELAEILQRVAEPGWVERPYGLGTDRADEPAEEREDGEEEKATFDERGPNITFPVRNERPDDTSVGELAQRLTERWQRGGGSAEVGLFDGYARAPSLWLGASPATAQRVPAVRAIHEHAAEVCRDKSGIDWEARRQLFQALRRACLRESVLLRLLPGKAEREERQWGELLAESFFSPLRGQIESMADRMAVFLEDIRSASGSVTTPGDPRHTLIEATRLKDQQFVALVSGGKDDRSRERVFAGFNTPLLPEVLVCTSVGQEGIDLHRHCRHVVHYDLAWNPAVLEQRTGRADRIGSKTFRERDRPNGAGDQTFLEIGVPFLAGTYDERMYEELRLRAQTFEVLTGGEVAAESSNAAGKEGADNREGDDEAPGAEGAPVELKLVALPDGMLDELRVQLHVWSEEGAVPLSVRAALAES